MMEEDKVLWVARYEEDDLSATERAEFEQQLPQDRQLQQHLSDYREIHRSLQMELGENADDQQFKSTLSEFGRQYFKDGPKAIKFSLLLRWMTSAAAILVIGLWIWSPWNKSPEDAFMEQNVMMVTDRGLTGDTKLDEAAADFNHQRYQEAKVSLKQLAAKAPDNAMVNYFYGLTLLKVNEFAEAVKVLDVIYNGESAFKYDAAYAIALAYWKQHNQSEAENWLKKIPPGTKNEELIEKLREELK